MVLSATKREKESIGCLGSRAIAAIPSLISPNLQRRSTSFTSHMKLRTYAVVVTLALIAALTNPSQDDHYAKLESVHPWVSESLLQSEISRRDRGRTPPKPFPELSQTPVLSYWSYGLASAVTFYPRIVYCPTGVTDKFISFGLFGFVFTF